MRAFAIYNPLVRKRRAFAWLLFEPSTDRFSIEIDYKAKPEDLPLTLALLAEDGKHIVEEPWARRWVEGRMVPADRENIDEVLHANRIDDYYLPALIAKTHGRSSLDDFLMEEVSASHYRGTNLNRVLESPVDLGVQLTRARRAADLTQNELAEACGVQQAVISRIEAGKGNPTIETLETIARGCGRTLHISLE